MCVDFDYSKHKDDVENHDKKNKNNSPVKVIKTSASAQSPAA